MKKGRLKRGIALLLSTMTLSMSVIPHLPPDILTAYAFHMNFNTSTSGDGHYDISGRVEGENEETDFLCMKKGASAKSAYNYFKTNNDVNYSEGSLEHKKPIVQIYLIRGTDKANPIRLIGVAANFLTDSCRKELGENAEAEVEKVLPFLKEENKK